MRALLRILILSAAFALALSACARSGDSPGDAAPSASPEPTPTPFRGLPDGVSSRTDSPAGVVAGEGRLIHVITYGSSSNPAVVYQVSAEGQRVNVHVSAEPGKPSTMDYTATTSAFWLPESVDVDQPVTFLLGDFGEVALESLEPGSQAWVEPQE